MMLTIHHLENSRSFRMVWLFEELQLEYQIKHYKRDRKLQLAPRELKAIHPLGKSPIVTDDDRILTETGAMIELILDRYAKGRLRPIRESAEYRDYLYWMHATEGSLMPFLIFKLILGRMVSYSPFFIKPVAKMLTSRVVQSYVDPGP